MLIIDAFNVLHAAGALGDGGALGRMSVPDLASLIASAPPPPGVSGTGQRLRVLLVCDGTAGGFAQTNPTLVSGPHGVDVQYLFAGPGRDADSVIENVLETQSQIGKARGCLVVSSDKRVQGAARAVRAKTLPAREFLVLIAHSIAPQSRDAQHADTRPAFAQATPLDPGSTRWWLKFFGYAVDEGDSGRPSSQPTSAREPTTSTPSRASNSPARNPAPSPAALTSPSRRSPKPESDRSDLRRALQTWGQGIKLDDLDMAQWLTDDFQPPPRPIDELDAPTASRSHASKGRKKRGG